MASADSTGKRLRGEAAHDVAGHGARHDGPALVLGLPAERVGEVRDEALHRRHGDGLAGAVSAAEQLVVGGHVALAGIGARHEVGVRGGGLDPEHGDRRPGRIRDWTRFRSGRRMAGPAGDTLPCSV